MGQLAVSGDGYNFGAICKKKCIFSIISLTFCRNRDIMDYLYLLESENRGLGGDGEVGCMCAKEEAVQRRSGLCGIEFAHLFRVPARLLTHCDSLFQREKISNRLFPTHSLLRRV